MNKMLENRRNKILAYNAKHDAGPLLFMNYKSQIVRIPDSELKFNKDGSPNRRRLVMSIISMSEKYSSVTEAGVYETSAERNRSALDIWRHAKAIYPDIDVFSIMEAIYKLCLNGELYGQFCRTVRRAVFYSSGSRGRHIGSRDRDELRWLCGEYRITFSTWENLHG